MDLNFNCLVFILFAFNRYIEGEQLFVSDEKTLWGEKICTLAIPNITFSNGEMFIETNGESPPSELTDGFWIGMFKTLLSYAYIGCNKMDDNNTFQVQTISECRWRSGCNTFAVRKFNKDYMDCKCFVSSDSTSLNKCNSGCAEIGNKYMCGSHNNHYFSIYSVENGLPSSDGENDTNKRCLGVDFDSENKQLKWWACEGDEKNVLCAITPFTAETEWTTIKIDDSFKKWRDAVKTCFTEAGFPVTNGHLEFANEANVASSLAFWTGIMRTNTVLRNDENMTTFYPKQPAYVLWDGNKLEVKFDSNKSAERRSLCTNEIGITTSATTTTGLTPTTSNTSTTIQQVTEVQTSDILTSKTIMTTNSHSPTSSTMVQSSIANEKNGKENKSLGQRHVSVVGISAGVSACVLLVVVIVILCFLKRRGMFRCFDAKSYLNNKDGTSHQDITPVYMEMDTKVKPKAFHNHAYSMQEQFPPITANDPNLESDAKCHLNESGENVYNTLDQPIEDYDDINPADVLQMNDYDSTLNCRNNYGNSEETYNHLNTEVRQMPTAENGYGHCAKPVNAGENNMVVGKPYDENPIMTNESVIFENMPHTPLQAIKQGDNVYNTVHRQAEEYDHINPADVKQQVDNYDLTSELPKDMGNKEETYNQLNEQIRRMPNAENVYGLNAEQKHETDYDTTAGTLSSHADKSVFGQDYDKINKIW